MQDIIQMCSFDASKSTKGASKLRRDLINTEIGHLRDLLPLPASTRQRLSQLQLMALVCVYVRKANYFQQVFKRHDLGQMPTPSIGFSKAMNGFLMMMTQNGKLLYISDNAAEYLGHSMEDLLIHGDSVYDIIDKQDHQSVQSELARPPGGGAVHHHHPATSDDARIFLCRMNVSRNARRQMRFGDQKVILVEGHYVSYLPLCTRNEPVLIATCTPVAMPETRECVVQGATNIFTSVHSMDMKFASIDASGEFYLGYSRQELVDVSWYQLLHWDYMREAQSKHRLITQSEQDRSCILLVRLQRRNGTWLWIHCVLQVKDASEAGQQPVIVCTNQVLSEREAQVMRANSWLYHYYLVQTKLQYGVNYEGQQQASTSTRSSTASASASPAGFSYQQQPAVNNNNSPGPSSSCSASGVETPTTPQPVYQQSLVTVPISSPLYAPPPPLPPSHHIHGHLYPDAYHHHFPMQQQQQHQQTNAYAFSPGHHQPGHHYGSFQNSYHLGQHQQQAHLIRTESFASTNSTSAETSDLAGYQVKGETKLDEYNSPVIDAAAAMYGATVNSVKEEPEPAVEEPASPVTSASSPPRKRYRLMATSLPSAPNYPPNGGPSVEHHHPGHHPGDHTQQHGQDWHRNHRSDHHPGYGQWPSTGWINSSYPVGLTQLDEIGYEEHVEENTFTPLVALSGASRGSPLRIHQRRSVQRRKQFTVEPPTSMMTVIRHHLVDSVQRVPDVSATMLPELSPLGYVLTPAPTPPDAEEASSLCYPLEGTETEQRVPEPTDSSVEQYAPLSALSAQAVEHPLLVTLPAVSHHYVYHQSHVPVHQQPFEPNDTTQDQQEPKTPPSMHSL